MYNTDFLPQLERFRRHLFRAGFTDPINASNEAHRRYSPPPGVKVVECYEDTNREYVPNPIILVPKTIEGKTSSG